MYDGEVSIVTLLYQYAVLQTTPADAYNMLMLGLRGKQIHCCMECKACAQKQVQAIADQSL